MQPENGGAAWPSLGGGATQGAQGSKPSGAWGAAQKKAPPTAPASKEDDFPSLGNKGKGSESTAAGGSWGAKSKGPASAPQKSPQPSQRELPAAAAKVAPEPTSPTLAPVEAPKPKGSWGKGKASNVVAASPEADRKAPATTASAAASSPGDVPTPASPVSPPKDSLWGKGNAASIVGSKKIEAAAVNTPAEPENSWRRAPGVATKKASGKDDHKDRWGTRDADTWAKPRQVKKEDVGGKWRPANVAAKPVSPKPAGDDEWVTASSKKDNRSGRVPTLIISII